MSVCREINDVLIYVLIEYAKHTEQFLRYTVL